MVNHVEVDHNGDLLSVGRAVALEAKLNVNGVLSTDVWYRLGWFNQTLVVDANVNRMLVIDVNVRDGGRFTVEVVDAWRTGGVALVDPTAVNVAGQSPATVARLRALTRGVIRERILAVSGP